MTGPTTATQRANAVKVRQTTRLIATIAAVLAAFSTVSLFWFSYALSSARTALRDVDLLPAFDARYDAIAAASAVGRLDLLAMILTFIGIIAALSLLYGWTAFRAHAVEAAVREIHVQLPLELASAMERDGTKYIAEALDDAELLARLQARFTSVLIDDTE
ncbi:hypothetical protein, partial [Actinobacillus pleuropneumoniae]